MTQPSVPQLAANFLAVADSMARGRDTNIVFRISYLRSVTMTTEEAAAAAAKFLVEEGYAYYGKHEDELGLRFTRLGFAHLRRTMSEDPPAVPPPMNVTTISSSTVGAVQQGTTSSSQSVDQVTTLAPTDVLVIRGFLATARDELAGLELADDERAAAERRLDHLEEEVNSEQPDRGRIRQLLDGLGQIAMGAAGSASWSGLQAVIEALAPDADAPVRGQSNPGAPLWELTRRPLGVHTPSLAPMEGTGLRAERPAHACA